MAVEARAPCGNCNNNNNNKKKKNNNNKVILLKIITDGNLTLTKPLFKKTLYLHNCVKKERVGFGGSRMGIKRNKISKAGRPCSWACNEKN
jgi:hypothetical protein